MNHVILLGPQVHSAQDVSAVCGDEDCGDPAEFYCETCETTYCADCGRVHFKKRKNAEHVKKQVNQTGGSGENSGEEGDNGRKGEDRE
jgi:hypothetical protein